MNQRRLALFTLFSTSTLAFAACSEVKQQTSNTDTDARAAVDAAQDPTTPASGPDASASLPNDSGSAEDAGIEPTDGASSPLDAAVSDSAATDAAPQASSVAPTTDAAPGSTAAADAESPNGGSPTSVYVMTTYHMLKFNLSDPTLAPVELSPVVGALGSYGRAGVSEPFDVSPDGEHLALLYNGLLHIAPFADLTADVSVSADAWAAAPRFTEDGQAVRFIRRSRMGGGRFDTVELVEVPLTGGTPTLVKSLPDPDFYTDLDKYTWSWDGAKIIGPARLEGRPDNAAKAHGFVSIDVASGAAMLHTQVYDNLYTWAQDTNEPSCSGNVCVRVHDGTTGENNGSFEPDSFHFLPNGNVYFTSNRDQYVAAGTSNGQRVYLEDTFEPGDYESLLPYTGERPVGYSRDGAYYAVFDGAPSYAVRVVRATDAQPVATFTTGLNSANIPTSVRFSH